MCIATNTLTCRLFSIGIAAAVFSDDVILTTGCVSEKPNKIAYVTKCHTAPKVVQYAGFVH